MDNILDEVRRLQNNDLPDDKINVNEESKIKKLIRFYFQYLHWIVRMLFYSYITYMLSNVILSDLSDKLNITYLSAICIYILGDIFIKPFFNKKELGK